jgi:hypothetical protein
VAVERLQVVAPGDPLRDLPHLRSIEHVTELGLADQDDL